MKYFLPLFFLVVGCGAAPEPILEYSGTDEYVSRFVNEGKSRGIASEVVSLKVEFKDIEKSNRLGTCRVGYNVPTITIDAPAWKRMSDLARELLMFHELGHCVLYKRHDDNKPGIMNTYMLDVRVYSGMRKEMLDDLFL